MNGIQAALGNPSPDFFESLADSEDEAKEAADLYRARNPSK